jgi:hypothetical protein
MLNMEPQKETARPIVEQLTEYAETRFKLLKYEVIERSTSIIANVVTDVVIDISLLLTFLFESFTLALFLADVFHSYWKGFGSVAVLYLIIALVVMFAKRTFERPIINALIRKLFN